MKPIIISNHMKNKLFLSVIILLSVMTTQAATYLEKYAGVLAHYQQANCHQQYEAALYLINNMHGHTSPTGLGIEQYTNKIKAFPPKTNIGKLSKAWNDCHTGNSTQMVPDSSIIDNDYLIANIDDAFQTWQQTPWKSHVSFQLFYEYILPYKVMSEYISNDWRQQLRTAYQGLLDGVTDIKEAFVILRKEVMRRVSNSNSFTPFCLDVMSYEHIRRANCDQRCILLASVLRAFGIPAAVDYVPVWADYSTMGHTWVSLVLGRHETFTVYEDESYPKRFNRIDASQFIDDSTFLDTLHCPYQIKNKKKVSKIYRIGYGISGDGLFGLHSHDVSEEYGLDGRLSVPCHAADSVMLCTFLSGKDWKPVSRILTVHGQAVFEHLGKGVVYLPIVAENGRNKPITPPVIVEDDGTERYLCAAKDSLSIALDRKYPLCAYMPVQWQKLIGSTIEGANTPFFDSVDTLAVIGTMPYSKTTITIDTPNQYRYVRFKSPNREIALLSELSFMDSNNRICTGRYLSEQVDTNRLSLLFDGDKETKIKAFQPGYWVGIDLGESPHALDHIVLTPVSDGNDIQKGHLYELHGYDGGWKLLGRRFAKDDSSLVFDRIPAGMLLLLKDKTRGHEERIFEYTNHQQIWY